MNKLLLRFGTGYIIHCRCEAEEVDDVLSLVLSTIPEAKLCERRSRLLVWQVEPNGQPVSALFRIMQQIRETHRTV